MGENGMKTILQFLTLSVAMSVQNIQMYDWWTRDKSSWRPLDSTTLNMNLVAHPHPNVNPFTFEKNELKQLTQSNLRTL